MAMTWQSQEMANDFVEETNENCSVKTAINLNKIRNEYLLNMLLDTYLKKLFFVC